jgi:non-specific protein-tyrosine kinase
VAGTVSRDEAYRVLRTNLVVSLADIEPRTVIVTSALPGEGKTSTCVNLAAALALAGHRLILLDLDLRHPDVHRWLGGHNESGVSDVLLQRRPLEECLQFVSLGESQSGRDRGLYLLPTGPPVAEPTELLGGGRLAKLLEALAEQADIVLIDSPPVLPVADTLVIGRMVAGAVLVVEARRTPIPDIEKTKDALIRNQTRLLGVVVNKVRSADVGYGYGYGYGYGDLTESVAAGRDGEGAISDSPSPPLASA